MDGLRTRLARRLYRLAMKVDPAPATVTREFGVRCQVDIDPKQVHATLLQMRRRNGGTLGLS